MNLVIVNAKVFDGESAELHDGPVHIADGRITALGSAAEPGEQVIDARGGTVLPGLIDAHCHAYGISLDLVTIETRPLSYLALAGARRLTEALARGFTTVRDVAGGDPGLAPVSQAKNREVLDAGRTAIELARAAGVRIGFGTDLMGELADEQLSGLRLQAEVTGVLATLRSATSVNADLLGRPDLGRVKAGCVADLLILDGDPFREPSVLWDPGTRRTIIANGVVVSDLGGAENPR